MITRANTEIGPKIITGLPFSSDFWPSVGYALGLVIVLSR
jgi:hypothetical protein